MAGDAITIGPTLGASQTALRVKAEKTRNTKLYSWQIQKEQI